jgi:lysophospholipase L1-like esterase
VNDYFPGKTIINRGFGGSRLLDLNNYADDLLTPYNPRQIVIYCGENDIATDNPTPAEVLERFKIFFEKIRQSIRKFLWLMFPSNIRQAVNNSGLR